MCRYADRQERQAEGAREARLNEKMGDKISVVGGRGMGMGKKTQRESETERQEEGH